MLFCDELFSSWGRFDYLSSKRSYRQIPGLRHLASLAGGDAHKNAHAFERG